jgi:hypothetical protein
MDEQKVRNAFALAKELADTMDTDTDLKRDAFNAVFAAMLYQPYEPEKEPETSSVE